MNVIPLQPLASQKFNVTLGAQSCVIALYQKSTGLYIDLTVNNAVVMTCVICRNRMLIVRLAYLGFVGDLVFVDSQGSDDPYYTGIGTRWLLYYLTPDDVTQATA